MTVTLKLFSTSGFFMFSRARVASAPCGGTLSVGVAVASRIAAIVAGIG